MKIFNIIVIFNPVNKILEKLLDNFQNFTYHNIIVDNSEIPTYILDSKNCNTEIVRLNDNMGIAFAQNFGINMAVSRGADYVAFYDQDSELDVNYSKNLISIISRVSYSVIVPSHIDKSNGFTFPLQRISRFGYLKKIPFCNTDKVPIKVDILISSGTVVKTEVFKKVGLMNEDFFIDYVDTEWAFRCWKMNVDIYAIPALRMFHSIGNKNINLFFINLHIHSPMRSYYKLRNFFLLKSLDHVPKLYLVKDLFSLLAHNLLLFFFVGDRTVYLKHLILAVKDGLLKKFGKSSEAHLS